MVHELHKLGYQRLAIFSGMAPSGLCWRCRMVPYDSIFKSPEGNLDIYGSDAGLVAEYSSGESNNYFCWADAKSDSARQLAEKFLDRFPRLAEAGFGENFKYSGWLNLMLGRSESGDLPVMYSDSGLDGSTCQGSETGSIIPFPPHHTLRIQEDVLFARRSISQYFVEENDWHTAYQPLIDTMRMGLRKNIPVIAPEYPLPLEVNSDDSYNDLLFKIGAYWEGAIYYLVTILLYESPEHFLSDYLSGNHTNSKEWKMFRIIWNDRGQLSLLLAYFCRAVLKDNYSFDPNHMGQARREQVRRWLDEFEGAHKRPLLYPNPYFGGGNPLHLGYASTRFCS